MFATCDTNMKQLASIKEKCNIEFLALCLRTDSCDERRVYKSEYFSGPRGGTYMFKTSPKSSDFCLSKHVW